MAESPQRDTALDRLLAAHPVGRVRWGLERIEHILESLGRPERCFRAIHVAGTNGKGSTAAMVESILRTMGTRTGLYTSPHLLDVRERVRVDGAVMAEDLLQRMAARVGVRAQAVGATYFECLTALAFSCFAESGVEWAVVETGLGGRLDATNVLLPAACAITSIGYDHTEYLGGTLARIAREKSGILKRGVPVAVGPLAAAPLAVVRARALEVGAPLHRVGSEVVVDDVSVGREGTELVYGREGRARRLKTALVGRHQAHNAAVALLMLEQLAEPPSAEAVREGLARTRWPGRCQVLGREDGVWLLDVAHNPAGMRVLRQALDDLALPEPLVFVLAILHDKPSAAMLSLLPGRTRAVVLCVPRSAPAERRWNPEAARAAVTAAPVEVVADLARALRRARELSGRGTVIVSGSHYVVGETLLHLEGKRTRRTDEIRANEERTDAI